MNKIIIINEYYQDSNVSQWKLQPRDTFVDDISNQKISSLLPQRRKYFLGWGTKLTYLSESLHGATECEHLTLFTEVL